MAAIGAMVLAVALRGAPAPSTRSSEPSPSGQVTSSAAPAPLVREASAGPRPTRRATPSPTPTAEPATEPTPVPVPLRGSGNLAIVPVDEAAPTGQLRYSVEIERELTFRGSPTARSIGEALEDERGWVSVLGTTFGQVVDDPQIRIIVATPGTTDILCAPLQTQGRVSCRNGDLVVLNAQRWVYGIPDYRGNLRDYRRYLVNHEVGHALGQGHVVCPGPGRPAPVMQQQSYGLDGCAQNPWPAIT